MKDLQIGANKRVFGLDVYRAVAILLVVMSHASYFTGDMFAWLPSVPLPDGVELFFVLSGFLIGTILIKTLEESERFGLKELLHFWKRRWFRTLPNYYLILLLYYILVSNSIIGGADAIEQFNWKFFFFAHNLYEGFYGFFWESWSLSVEEWFYISLPLIIIALRTFLSKRHTLLAAIGILIVFPMLYRYSQADMNYDDFWFGVEIRKVVIVRLDTIIYGVLAAYVAYYYKDFWRKTRWLTFALGMLTIGVVMYTPHPIDQLYGKVFYYTVFSIGAALLLPMASALRKNPLGIIGRAITYVSIISYAMYLVNHWVALIIVKHYFPLTMKQHWLAYAVFWTATITISSLIYYFYERPMTRLRDKF
ncbi:MAG: acyltransferase [Crocinitomicaceae bacterium]